MYSLTAGVRTTLGACLVLCGVAGTGCRGDAESRAAADSPGAATPAAAAWTVTPRGIGPVRAGATLAEARAALGGELAAPDSGATCTHVALPAAPGETLAMIVDGRVARIEVRDSLVATDRGARVGDTEARIDSLYRGRVRVEPHKYTDGHYLVVTPEAQADSAYRLIFETDGRRVTEYRAGLLPAVAWVEGCS